MQEIEEASLPDLFGGREKRSPQHIKILPEKKQESFLGFAPTSMNRCLQSNHDSLFSDFVKEALTFKPTLTQSNCTVQLGTAYQNSGHVWLSLARSFKHFRYAKLSSLPNCSL